MATNDLTPLQDVLTREFLLEVVLKENVLANNPATKKRLIRVIYDLLNYQRLADGRFVSKDKKVTHLLGQPPSVKDFPDEWSYDYDNALMKLGQGERRDLKEKVQRPPADYSDTYEADSSEPTKNPSLWQTLFSKDV